MSRNHQQRSEREWREESKIVLRKDQNQEQAREQRQGQMQQVPRIGTAEGDPFHSTDAPACSSTWSAMYELRTNGPLKTILKPIAWPKSR